MPKGSSGSDNRLGLSKKDAACSRPLSSVAGQISFWVGHFGFEGYLSSIFSGGHFNHPSAIVERVATSPGNPPSTVFAQIYALNMDYIEENVNFLSSFILRLFSMNLVILFPLFVHNFCLFL